MHKSRVSRCERKVRPLSSFFAYNWQSRSMSLCLASELEPDCPINYHHIIKMNLALKCLHHPQEPLDMLCLQPTCEKGGLVCYLCKVEEHVDHNPILPLKIFLGELLDKSSDSQEFVKETAMIDKELLSIQQRFLLLRSKMAAPNLADQAFLNFWKETLASINHFDRMIVELKDILADRGDDLIKELNQWVRKNGGHYSQKDEESKDNAYVGFLKGKLDSLKTVRQQIQKYDLRSSFEDSDILSLFVTHTAVKFFRLRFSEELKGTCMTISSPTRASMTVHGNQRMMLLQPHLGISRSVKRWKVKIQKLASWIGVGVAHLDTIKGVNFDFSYTNANHGNYLISSNGYSWNGYKMEFNSKYETFQYTTGDTIEVTYDPTGNKVSFKKEGGEATFSYDVDPSQKPIHAAINLTGVGDAVQIIL